MRVRTKHRMRSVSRVTREVNDQIRSIAVSAGVIVLVYYACRHLFESIYVVVGCLAATAMFLVSYFSVISKKIRGRGGRP